MPIFGKRLGQEIIIWLSLLTFPLLVLKYLLMPRPQYSGEIPNLGYEVDLGYQGGVTLR